MVHNMADSKASGFSKVVQKHSLRAKERFLQNFGKKDRTTDELFEIYQNNFSKQQSAAARLQKELKNYATCAREMQAASKSLMECVADVYEHDWPGQDQMPAKVQTLELLWGDLCHKINDQGTIPLSTYLSQFSEVRNKMEKRGRKLLDYDGCRHSLETVQTASKRRDDIKVAKAREQMEEARRLYEVLNKELHEELPALYDSRIPFLVQIFQTMFESEAEFHREYAKVYEQFCQQTELLSAEVAKGSFVTDLSSSPYLQARDAMIMANNTSSGDEGMNTSDVRSSSPNYAMINNNSPLSSPNSQNDKFVFNNGAPVSGGGGMDNNGEPVLHEEKTAELHAGANSVINVNTNGDATKKKDELFEIPIGATTKDLPPGVLYKVKATYKYGAEDVDELTFEAGEIVHVVQYDDPEEQEEGWLMGIRELTGDKGLFPANFTRPI